MKNKSFPDFFSDKSLLKKYLMIMKLSTFLFLIATLPISAVSYSQNTKIRFSEQPETLSQVIEAIENQTDYKIFYKTDQVNVENKVEIHDLEGTISYFLTQSLKGSNISFSLIDRLIVLAPKENINQQKPVTGRITDGLSGEPLPGVNIYIQGTALGTVSDLQGNYTIEVPEGNAVLVFSFIGYITENVALQDQRSIDVKLLPDYTDLDEVVVVGYGTQKKRDIIGSVATITSDNVNLKTNSTFDGGLQGIAAGVSVMSQSGAPGAASIIKIRGTNSINSSTDPLWIIDGMPVYSSPSGLGSSNQNPMSLINPNDIESIQVLKDAAATAIYGSRASNGVILVTTKNGKKVGGSMSFNFSSGISSLSRTPEDVGYVNTKEWFQVMDAAYQNTYLRDFEMLDYYQSAPQAKTVLTREEALNNNTNWYNELFHNGSFQDYNISGSKGFENGSLYVSVNYRKDQGVQKFNNLERFSVRSNLMFNPVKNLTLSAKITFGNSNNNKRNSGTTSIVTYALPWFPIKDPSNNNLYFNAYTGANPAALNDPDNYLNNSKQFRGLGGLSADYNLPFIKGLSFRSEFSADVLQSNSVLWQSRDIRLSGTEPSSFGSEEVVTFQGINYNLYGSYDKSFDEHEHVLNLVAGTEATRKNEYYRYSSGQNLNGKYQELGSPNTMLSMFGGFGKEEYFKGYFFRFNYKYKDKYILGISGREDGASAFTEENRWGTFFGASAGWIISEESFMQNLIGEGNFIKIRGSYGEIGNSNIPSNLDVINYNGYPINYGSIAIGGVNGTVPVNMANRGLKWETTKSTDAGIDFGIRQNRINGSLAFYHRLITNMLLQVPLPVSSGISGLPYDYASNNVWSNIGNMVNSGIEIDLHSVNININSFRWSTDFNVAFNRNVIQKLSPEADMAGTGLRSSNDVAISRKGEIREEWFIADWAGVSRLTGLPMIYALNQEKYSETGETEHLTNSRGTDSLIYATRSNIQANRFYQTGKSADPKYFGGLTNSFQYKNFDFSFMVSFSGGNYILDYDRQIAAVPNANTVVLRELYENSWKTIGEVAKYPQLVAKGTYKINGVPSADFGDSYVYHNRELYKGDYLRLRNVQFGYNLNSAWANKVKVQSLRFYISASNLFTMTKYPGFDPEGAGLIFYSSSIPQLKSVMVGLDLKF